MIRYEKHLNLMDILSQYKQQHPEAFQEKTPARMSDEYGREYTGMVRWVVRLSGGRIRDARTASYFLLALAGVAAVIAFFLFAQNFNILPAKKFSAQDAARQQEEYRKIQPF